MSTTLPSPLGPLTPFASDAGITALWLGDNPPTHPAPPSPAALRHLHHLTDELTAYLAGTLDTFTIPLAPVGTPFQHQVWRALQQIPAGQTRSYAHIARAIGRPAALRAVARANATNPIAILIPCHRVIGSDGSLTGYAGGLERKQWLLDHERRFWGHHQTPAACHQPRLWTAGASSL